MQSRAPRSQAAIDFITSYGFAILIIAVAIYAVFQIGVFNYSSAPSYCYTDPPFSCVAYTINSAGALAVIISQSSGGILTINGLACSTTPNASRVGPEYGNIGVDSQASFYPGWKLAGNNIVNPGTQSLLYANCYASANGIARSSLGSTFNGYIWLNYTFSGLPQGYHTIGRIASISVKYT